MEANEWATPTVYLALAFGLAIVIFAGIRALFGRSQSFLQPDIACMIFMWCSYHLSPIIVLVSGKNWRAFMLSTEYISNALWMSVASSVCFAVGYRCLMTSDERNAHAIQSWSERASAILGRGSLIKKWHLWLAIVPVLLMFVTISGGIGEVWEASYTRGDGNWLEQTFEVRLIRFIAVILPLSSLALIAVTTIYSTSSEKSLSKYVTIAACLLTASLSPLHGFSRSAGVAFFCLAIIRFVLRGSRDAKICAISMVFGMWLSYVGYQFRSDYRPGIGCFLEAAGRSLVELPEFESIGGQENELISPEDNFLSAIEAYTAVAAYVDYEELFPCSDLLEFFYNLHPFPSGFVGLASRGVDLTLLFGMQGQVGLTTPMMGDLYITFGYATPLFYFALGILYFFMHSHAKRFGPSIETILLLILFLTWPLAGHSAFRAQWRLINIVLLAIFGLYLLKRRGYFKHIETSTSPSPVMRRFTTGKPNRIAVR